MSDPVLHDLRERVKELTCLHRTARILQDVHRPTAELMPEVVDLLPLAWQHPEIAAARIRFCNRGWHTPRFRITPWTQESRFRARNGLEGTVEVAYLEERPLQDEGPFLAEERQLIDSLAEMLRAHFDHVIADSELRDANEDLERQVRERTADLRREAADHRLTSDQLRRLAAEISLAEARERRRIASDLHDHIGQGLAFTRMQVSQLRGDSMFSGFENMLDRIITLLDQTIGYTRDLTVQISPPVLYELGLGPALEWLGERVAGQTGLKVAVECGDLGEIPEELAVMLFKSTQELLANVAKHSGAGSASVAAERRGGRIEIEVADSGRGFDVGEARARIADGASFGLFSIRERIGQLGGGLAIDAAPGRGARLTLSAPVPGGA